MIMNDRQNEKIIYIGLFVVCFLIYYFTKNVFLFGILFGILLFEIFNLIYAKNDKRKIGIGIVVGVVLYVLIMLLCKW